MLDDYLYEQNIQWQNRIFDSGIERDLLPDVIPLLEIDHAVALSGVRRCGKSYLLKQIINHLLRIGVPPGNILLANLELPEFFGRPAAGILDEIWNTYLRLKNPEGRLYFFIDEVQTLPGWETWVKYHYDQKKGNLKFILTGSNSRLLSAEFATLLSGRVVEKKLFPFSFAEAVRLMGIGFRDTQEYVLNRNRILHAFDRYLSEGGMPETLSVEDREIRKELITSYFTTAVYKDIVPRFSVRQSGFLKDLALRLLGQTGQIVNLSRLASVFDSNRNTVKEFMSFLEMSFLILFMEKFDYSAGKRQAALKKCYAVDNGFAAHIPLRFTPDTGALFENLVAVEMYRRYGDVFYWRNNAEWDFLVSGPDGKPMAVQACYRLNEENRRRESAGLKAGCDLLGIGSGLILTYDQSEEFDHLGMHVRVMPAHEWLLKEGAE